MASLDQTLKVRVDVNDIEIVDGKMPYQKVSAPSIIENVRAAGLEGTRATGPRSAITGITGIT